MRSFPVLFLLVPLAFLAGCGSEDPAGPSARGDTVPPSVIEHTPGPFRLSVQGDEPIVIRFDEAMDPASASGAISISAEDTFTTTWTDDRTLQIDHPGYRSGDWITVRIEDRLTDLAGNRLASAVEFSYGIYTNDFKFLGSTPADSARAVDRNTLILLQFTQPPDRLSLSSRTYVEAEVEGSMVTQDDFVRLAGHGQAILTLDDPLPPDSRVVVHMLANIESQSGDTTPFRREFTFWTGGNADTRPPSLVRVEPSLAEPVDPATRALRLVFDEPMDVVRFAPSLVSAQLAIELARHDLQPIWSADRTTWSLPLPHPLPAGLPILLEFDSLLDFAGNESAAGLSLRMSVAGDADPYPITDGVTKEWLIRVNRRSGGTNTPSLATHYIEETHVNDGSFRLTILDDEMEQVLGYERYRREDDAIRILAKTEDIPGAIGPEIVYDPGLSVLRQPIRYGSWAEVVTARSPSDTTTIDSRLSFLGLVDLDPEGQLAIRVPGDHRVIDDPVVWADTWKTVLDYDVFREGERIAAVSDTTWFAPGFGPVRRESVAQELEGEVSTETRMRLFTVDESR